MTNLKNNVSEMCIANPDKWSQFKKILFSMIITLIILIVVATLIFITVVFTTSTHTSNDLIVELPTGKIRGRIDISLKGNVKFYSFLQIPYGEPPIGKLRFMAPIPVQKWHHVLNCTRITKTCYRLSDIDPIDSNSNGTNATENCLYLNVFTPVKPGSNPSLPVMFYIYGDDCNSGNNNFSSYGPHYFMEERVIIVTVSYRLHAFGFLSTNDEIIPGNAGLKDQNLALKWTHENIHLFGGDPNKVTIFGESFGSASTAYHILSKKSAGLFRSAICQSGSAISPWAYQRNARSIAYQLATIVIPYFNKNCSSLELLNFLQRIPASTLNQASYELVHAIRVVQLRQYFDGFIFAPVIEPSNVQDAFITELMYSSFDKGNFNQVPLMIGISSEEGIFWAQNSQYMFIMGIEEEENLPISADFHIDDKDEKLAVFNLSKTIYTDRKVLANDLQAAIRYYSDNIITRSVIRQAHLQSIYNDVYFYQFSYHGKLGHNFLYFDGAERVKHCEDLNYLWCINNVSKISNHYPESDITTLDRYVRLLTNFAKYLNPTPKPDNLLQNITWPKFMLNNFTYLNINDSLEIKSNPKEDVYNKWVDLYEKYANKPYDTY